MTNRFRSTLISLSIFLFLLTLYHTLVLGGVVLPSDGINGPQSNNIKAQRYIYNRKSDLEMVLVGSSISGRLNPDDISDRAVSLAMLGMSSQTGLEIVEKQKIKPNLLLIELNDTIQKRRNDKLNTEFIGNLYHPIFYWIRFHLPMFRQEYQPVSTIVKPLIKALTNEDKVLFRFLEEGSSTNKRIDTELIEKLIRQQIKAKNHPISEQSTKAITEESEYMKTQIKKFKNEGVRVVLMDIPNEKRVKETIMEKQLRELFRELFPKDTYEWMPEPPSRDWKTNDGIHLVTSSAKEYANFLRTQLFKTAQ